MGSENLRFRREILGVAILLSLGSLMILYPFLDPIIVAVATAYLLRFAHKALNSRIHNDTLASVIVTSSILGLLLIGTYFFINNFTDILTSLNQLTGSLSQGVQNVVDYLNLSQQFEAKVLDFINTLSNRINRGLLRTFTEIPSLFIELGIYLVTSIYFYRDGAKIEKKIFDILEGLPSQEEKIIRSLIRSIDSIFRGVFVTQFIVAAILGLVTAAGFYAISLVTSPMPLIPVWALLIGIAALLPLIAAFLFYGPIGVYYLIAGEPLKGTLILVFGVVMLNILPEILIRPYIGSKQMDEHPLIIFTGFLAGPLALGLKGIILGPLILILTKEFVLNYTDLVSGETG